MPSPGRFPLTRYFVLTGILTAVVVGTVLATVSAGEVQRDLLEERQNFAVLVARNLNVEVHHRFITPTLARAGYVDLDAPEQLEALDDVVKTAIAELGIENVYFFDLGGRISYSTRLEHRGFTVGDNPNYWKAVGGEVSTVEVTRGAPLDVSGQAGAVPLLETYVPVHNLDAQGQSTGQLSGVIEIYQDASSLVAGVREARRRVMTYSVLAVASLMLALWLWIRKAERAIDERTAALEALSRDLERQVDDRTHRLLRAETLATVGTLSAGVAHEINNPLAAIASCSEGLLRRARDSEALRAEEDFADFPDYLAIIRDEAFRVKEITRNLLDFARTGGERRDPVELGSLLQATARLLGHRIEQEGKRLELACPETPVQVEGDGASLRQLVLNLTVNALDACPVGGLVRWTLATSERGARLTCEDDGPGFSAEALAHALEPFYTGKAPGQGTGLGLAISYAVVRQHGGTIELGNREQGGARVAVELPGGSGHGQEQA